MRVAHWRGIVLGSGLLLGLTACGTTEPTAPLAPPPAPSAAGSLAPATAIPPTLPAVASSTPSAILPTATALPATATAVLPSATAVPATASPLAATATVPLPTATPHAAIPSPQAARPTATAEAEDCFSSVGAVYHWLDLVNGHRAGDIAGIEAGLTSACVDDRRLALWALGSVHEAAGGALLDRYLAAHSRGDWVRDEYDLLPVAQAARAYLDAPQTKTDTYAVRPISIYSTIPQYDADSRPLTAPVGHIAPGTRLTRLARVPTDRTRPDHGGATALVFERVQPAGDNRVYFIDISQYVVADPPYFAPPAPAQP